MAKGIRSRSMRKNRTALRETLANPIVRKRQEEMSNSIKKSLAKRSAGTIMGLKNIFSQNKPSELKETIKMNQEKEIEEEEEETEIVEAVGKGDKFNLSASSKIRNNSRPKAFKASRSKKEMVWFK